MQVRVQHLPNDCSPSLKKLNQLDQQKQATFVKFSDHIYLGSIESTKEYDTLKSHHIDYVLNLTNSFIQAKSNCQINCLNQPLSSKKFSCLMKIIPECVTYIDKAINSGKKIAICCRDGYSRTLVVLTAYYILKYNKDFQTVYNQIKQTLPNLSINISPEYGTHLDNMRQMVNDASIKHV